MGNLSGKQFGGYRVVEPLGEGGMGAVFIAYQSSMDRYVAIKVLPRRLASNPEYLGRFIQEAKFLANLQHSHILPIFDYGESDGYTYLVMPLVRSGTLAQTFNGAPQPLKRIRTVISQIGDALDYAHAKGLVHRDIKPSNVLLDERGNCLLTDFGIARIVESTSRLTQTGEIIGTPAYMSPEQGQGKKVDARSDIYALGIILYEMAVGCVPFKGETPVVVIIKHVQEPLPMPRENNPNLPEAVEKVILKALAKDPAERYPNAAAMVAAIQAAIPDESSWINEDAPPTGASEPPAPGESPYMGMRYFDTADAGLFFGRATLTHELSARLASERFLAIVGASGSGKSSLARAGLVPAWTSGIEYHGATLTGEVHLITPTNHPLESLAASLTRQSESVTATATLMDDLRKDSRCLYLYVRKLLNLSGQEHMLLVVDQFEETFTACKDLNERKAFIANLLTAVSRESGRALHIVITLRADFYHHCAEYENLRQAIEKHQAYIGAMTPDELRQAIEAPALKDGWQFQPGLVDLILQDVGDEPGALPLLSHALLETWHRRQGRTLTLEGYAAAGGVRKAIAHTAESVYHHLAPADQVIARGIFLRLTKLGEGDQDTRRRVLLDELALAPKQQAAVDAVLKMLTDARLVTTSQDSAEVAHEALIREWPTLRGWLDEERSRLRLHRHLTESAQEWERRGRDPGELYTGARLSQAQEWTEQPGTHLNPLEQQFLDAALGAARRAEAEREERRQRELEQAQRLVQTQRQRALLLAVGLGVAILLAGLSFWFYRQGQANLGEARISGTQAVVNLQTAEAEQKRADNQSRLALARQLAAQAQSIFGTGSAKQMVAVLLAAQSIQIFPSFEAAQVLQNNTLARQTARMTHEDAVTSVAFSPDGRYVVSGSTDNTARVWDAASGAEIARMTHADDVTSVAFSPDGKDVVSGSYDGTARVWKAASGAEIARMTHDGYVTSVAFSPDGKYVVSGSYDGTARAWKAASGAEIARMTHDGYVNSVAFSPDSKVVVSGSNDKTARAWKAASGAEIARMTHDFEVTSVAFSPDGSSVVSGSWDKTARTWEAASGVEIARMTHDDIVRSVAFSPDGKVVVSGSYDGTARVWEAASGVEIARMTHDDIVWSVAFNPDGRVVVSGSADKTARVWDAASGKEIARMTHDDDVYSVAFSPDGKGVASGSADKTARAWDAASGAEIARMTHRSAVTSVAFSLDSKFVVSGSWDKTVRVWEAASGIEIARMTHDDGVLSVAFSPDGRYVVSGSADKTARVWEIASWTEITRMTHEDAVTSVAFSPDGKYVISGSTDNTARVWDAGSGAEIARMTHDDDVTSVAFSPNGKDVVSGSYDGTVRVWKAASGVEIARMTHEGYVTSVAYSPDSRYVVSGSYDGTARVWEIASGAEIARMTHDDVVRSVAFSPDGKDVVSGSDDKTARVWEVASGEESARMTHDDDVTSVAFSPNGKYVVSGSSDKTAQVWLWRPEDLIAAACDHVPRNLTRAEWKKYIGDALPYQAVCPNLPLEPELIPTPTPTP